MTPGIALVTGAGARLGRAMALALGEDGWKVAVHYHSSSTITALPMARMRPAR